MQPSLAQTVAMVCIKLKMTLRVLLVNIVQPKKRSSPKVNFALTVMLENTRPKTLKQSVICKFCPLGFQFQSKSTACNACATGMFQSVSNLANAQCQYCDAGKRLLVQPSLAQTVAMVCIKLKMTLRVPLVNIVQPEKFVTKSQLALTVMLENTGPKTLEQVPHAIHAPLEKYFTLTTTVCNSVPMATIKPVIPKLGPHAKHATKAQSTTHLKRAHLVRAASTNPRRAFQVWSANFAQREKNLLTKVPLVVHALLGCINWNRGVASLSL